MLLTPDSTLFRKIALSNDSFEIRHLPITVVLPHLVRDLGGGWHKSVTEYPILLHELVIGILPPHSLRKKELSICSVPLVQRLPATFFMVWCTFVYDACCPTMGTGALFSWRALSEWSELDRPLVSRGGSIL